jgi:DNA-binding MarR family transcriptional regulator
MRVESNGFAARAGAIGLPASSYQVILSRSPPSPPAEPMDSQRNFGFLLKDVSHLYSRNFERHAAGLALTLEQCRILTHLARNEGVSQARLAELTDTDPMTLGRIVERMEGEQLVERRADPDDRRVRTLFLRPAAGPLLQTIWTLSDRARSEALAGLAAGDRAQLVRLMKRIRDNLDTLMPGSADRAGEPAARRSRGRHDATRA